MTEAKVTNNGKVKLADAETSIEYHAGFGIFERQGLIYICKTGQPFIEMTIGGNDNKGYSNPHNTYEDIAKTILGDYPNQNKREFQNILLYPIPQGLEDWVTPSIENVEKVGGILQEEGLNVWIQRWKN